MEINKIMNPINLPEEEDPITRIFMVCHHETPEKGPFLEMVDCDEDYVSDSDDDGPGNSTPYMFTNVSCRIYNDDIHIYHVIINHDHCDARFLRTFSSYEEAENYAKQQYYMINYDYPVIKNIGRIGFTNITFAQEVYLSKSIHEYLVIMNRDDLEAHSLNYFSVW